MFEIHKDFGTLLKIISKFTNQGPRDIDIILRMKMDVIKHKKHLITMSQKSEEGFSKGFQFIE